MKHIPNIITSLNLASGFIAIVLVYNGYPVIASWVILAAMVFDFFDGFASRALNAYSEMGKELDSIADVISFGAAPGLIIYTLLSASHGSDTDGWKIATVAISALFPVCAGLRLAKFNIDDSQTTSFKGLPTPAAALAVVTVVLSAACSGSTLVKSLTASPVAIIIFSLVLSGLMVTRIPLLSLKFHNLKLKGNEGRFLLIGVVILLVALFRFAGIPLIIPAYVAVSLISLLF
ncbi:MAG TPA: CDP-diacylglycerol--serine O-phosphatidyltransferase [Bacteroidales bacterium]|nr:CDP-diacylglycerol--serine O-phosphatidyltransferase [Bacteroidales bacterium]